VSGGVGFPGKIILYLIAIASLKDDKWESDPVQAYNAGIILCLVSVVFFTSSIASSRFNQLLSNNQ
jgi:hypothetical protein